jgi:hypothetical protein
MAGIHSPQSPVRSAQSATGDSLVLVRIARALTMVDDIQDQLIAMAVDINARQQADAARRELTEEMLRR